MNSTYIAQQFLFISFIAWTANSIADGTKHIKELVANPGGGVCQESWAKRLQEESSVRLDEEFLDKDGKPIATSEIPGGNPQPFCSASLARVGAAKKLKIVTAAHCIEDEFYASTDGVSKPATGADEHRPPMPPGAHSKRIVAWVGGMGPAIPIKTFRGPKLPRGEGSVESTRKDDFAILDAEGDLLEKRFAGRTTPELCAPTLSKSDVEKAAVIGFGFTNGNQPSRLPLCGQQEVKEIANKTINIAPYRQDFPTACPGDSGGGLWFVPKTQGAQPCLAGTVSGPREGSASDPNKRPNTPIEHCTREGLIMTYSAVFQQQTDIDRYIAEAVNTRDRIPAEESQ